MAGPHETLPWLGDVLRQTLATRRGHALLIHGPQGVGQFELAMTVAQAWLCEAAADAPPVRPCGNCAACRLVQARSHPDLLVLLPEMLQQALGWGAPADADGAASERAGKAKPSKEIKVEAIRAAVTFAQTTSARGHGKVVVLHPAESMNAIAANTLLKTLEEPPGEARFLLSCAAPDALLPTIRSRCQSVTMGLPAPEEAVAWLAQQGVDEPAELLAAAGGQPQLALEWSQQGVDVALWRKLPTMVRQGQSSALTAWPLPRVVDALQKLCHDVGCISAGSVPRYFASGAIVLASGLDLRALSHWMRELNRVARHAEHPWNAGLMIESLVQQGQRALAGGTHEDPGRQDVSVHSLP